MSVLESAKKYNTYTIKSWYDYQKITPSHLHSIPHYYATCEEQAKLCPENVMVLRDEIIKITGWHWTTGWPAQNCADTNGYTDVRTNKKYNNNSSGNYTFFEDIK